MTLRDLVRDPVPDPVPTPSPGAPEATPSPVPYPVGDGVAEHPVPDPVPAAAGGALPAVAAGALTVAVLAARAGIDADQLEQLLDESREQGIVERAGDGWRLTAHADRRYGRALRGLHPGAADADGADAADDTDAADGADAAGDLEGGVCGAGERRTPAPRHVSARDIHRGYRGE